MWRYIAEYREVQKEEVACKKQEASQTSGHEDICYAASQGRDGSVHVYRHNSVAHNEEAGRLVKEGVIQGPQGQEAQQATGHTVGQAQAQEPLGERR